MSKIEVNAIEPQCGTTLTVGASGDTVDFSNASVTFPSGTGTVNWDTTAKTASFTAVSGNGYFVNTTSGAITVTLPASPSSGDIVSISDYTGTFGTNNCTVGRNSSNINGSASDWVIAVTDTSITFVYVDGTEGWRVVNTSLPSETENPFLSATGGTETTCGDFKIHTFTGPGTFTVCKVGAVDANNVVDYLVIAGGGGGDNANGGGGGGGGGGYRESCGTCYTSSPLGCGVSALPVTAQGYPITVGAGGGGGTFTPVPSDPEGERGSNSVFSTITSTGGGAGSGNGPNNPAMPGGSGGGASYAQPIGTGNTPPVSPPQGNPGGSASGSPPVYGGGGGGGATAAGTNGHSTFRGNGGAGGTSSINGTPTGRSGGGGGGGITSSPGGTASDGGGAGGGGVNGTSGTTNTGGGGGGSGAFPRTSGSGGSGIVIIRYKYQ